MAAEVADPELGLPPAPSSTSSNSLPANPNSYYHTTSTCLRFWGPLRAGGHTLREAGGSILLPKLPFLLWRSLAFLYLLVTLIYVLIDHSSFRYFTIWSYTGLTFAFLLMTIASFRHWRQKSCYEDETRLFARWTVCAFQIFATAALFIDIVFWAVLFDRKNGVKFGTITTHGLNLVIVLIDMFVGLNMQFRLWNCLASFLYFLLYYGFMWVYWAINRRWVYDIFDWNKHKAGKVAVYHVVLMLGAIVAPFIMFFLNRINRLFRDEPRDRRNGSSTSKV